MADPHTGLQDGDLTTVVVEDVTKEGSEQPSLKKSVSFQSDSGFKDPDEVGVVRSGHFSQRRKSRLSIRSFGWSPRKYHLKIRFVLSGVISERILSQNLLLCLQECVHRIIWRRKWGAWLTSHLRTHGHRIIVEIKLKNINFLTIADYQSSWTGSSLATFPGTKDHHCQHSSFSWRPNFRLLTGLFIFSFW